MEEEKPTIASVYLNRVNYHYRLQADPTIAYALEEQGKTRKKIYYKDLSIDSPYNTYKNYGLPPTPIALPGLAALQAAAHPADGEAMFFVANGQGGHTFSSTLEAHNKAVRTLIKANKNKPVEPGSEE